MNRGIMSTLAVFLALVLAVAVHAGIGVQQDGDSKVQVAVDWPAFMARHDMLWKKLPTKWSEAPWTGNGMLGSMVWREGDALRLQVFRGDVQTHRPMTQGHSGYTRSRIQIGSFYLQPVGKLLGCDWRMDYWNAELVGTVLTDKGTIKIRHFTHAGDMAIVTEWAGEGGEKGCVVRWEAASPMPTRSRGCPVNEAALKTAQKQYKSKYPTELYVPEQPAQTQIVDGVELCVQDLVGNARHVTAWRLAQPAPARQRLVVSIGNRWPDRSNDPLRDAVDVVRRVAAMPENEYTEWKKHHYRWWHEYYPASFVSVPETPVETLYWTQMYKLGSATRADGVMIDTAGIWQTPSRWPFVTWDFNTQYCYYPLPTANRLELAQSLIRTFSKYRDNLVKNVRPEEWQSDSAYLSVNTGLDLYQPKDVDERDVANSGAHLVWAMHACWLIYRNSMDDGMLRETVYPLLRRAVNYQIHRLEKRTDGKYHVPISISPELCQARDVLYELSLLRWGCQSLLAAGKRLGIAPGESDKYRDVLSNLVDYPVDEVTGYMVGEGRTFKEAHRHWSHLMMMHPLQLVTGRSPEERALMRKSVLNFQEVNERGRAVGAFEFTGRSAMWALLGEGDAALAALHQFMNWRDCTRNGLYQEGNNPCLESPIYTSQCVHEMLMQCYDEWPAGEGLQAAIRVFPAMPKTWQDAVFHNLRTPGSFLVSAVREGGKTRWVRIKSLAGEPCRVKVKFDGAVKLAAVRPLELKLLAPELYEVPLIKGEEIVLYSGEKPAEFKIEPVAIKGDTNFYGLKQ